MTRGETGDEPGADRTAGGPQARIERDELRRGRRPAGSPPVEPREAATIVLARPGFELLLLRRPETTRFAAGAYVFPGGVIDPADEDEALAPALPKMEGLDGPGRAALVCALRELFEETGLLPADAKGPGGSGKTGGGSGGPAGARADRGQIRARLLADEITFTDVVAELGVTFGSLRVAYLSRWITPAAFSRRYDTRFFLAATDATEPPELTEEHTAFEWLTAPAALDAFREGRLPMLFPTWKTLETLARYETVEATIAACGGRDVRPVTPRLEVQGDRVRPLVPGDPGYEEAG